MLHFGIRYDRKRESGDLGYKPRIIAGEYCKHWGSGWKEFSYLYPTDLTILDGEITRTWDQLHPGPPYKEGGPFSSYRSYIPGRNIQGWGYYYKDFFPYGFPPPGNQWYRLYYNGGFYPMNWPLSNPLTATSLTTTGVSGYLSGTYGDATALGPTAWNRLKPKLSTSDLGVFFAEIRETPRMLKTSARFFKDLWRSMGGNLTGHTMSRKAADHWLNTQFGWRPFISDLTKGFKTFCNADKQLKAYREKNGTWIRRAGPVNSDVQTQDLVVSYDGVYSPYVQPCVGGYLMPAASTKIFREITQKTWFVGMFRYYIPSLAVDSSEQLSTIQNYLRLYGIRINPMLVWNITPWTWLADWVANIGDNISNFTSIQQDNMASKYAYIMQSTVHNLVNYSKVTTIFGTKNMVWTLGNTVKTRRAASPFGFSVDVPNFSARQWSILAALGFSRSKIEDRYYN